MRRLAVHVTPANERALRAGSPWVYADAITRTSFAADPGTIAVVFDRAERFLAIGLWDPDADIAFRALAHAPATIDAAFFDARIRTAHAARAPIAVAHTGYRVAFGEADALPGLVIDRYADTAVLRLYTAAWIPWLGAVQAGVDAAFAPARIVLRLSRNVADLPHRLAGLADGSVLAGSAPDAPIEFTENGLRFCADVVRGQKTGFFLDQRDNRARVAELARGRRVLDAFAYTGAFSVNAARGGAVEVTSLDASAPALAACRETFAQNRADPQVAACRHETLLGDAFERLPELLRQGRCFDLVILDPPAFAKRRSEVEGALRAYARLVRMGLGVLAPRGVLVACSCSSRVDAAAFAATVREAAGAAGRRLRVLATTGHAADHPATKELQYLKAVFAEVEGGD